MRKFVILALVIAILVAGCAGNETIKVVRINRTNVTANVTVPAPQNTTPNVTANISSNISANISANISSNISANLSSNSSNLTANTTSNETENSSVPAATNSERVRNLTVDFIDLGGNSILIRTPTKKNIIIDGGKNNDGLRLVKYLLAKGISKFEYIFDSNADSANSGALSSIIFNFNNSQSYATAIDYSTAYTGFRSYRNYAKAYSYPSIPMTESRVFDIEDGLKLSAFVPYEEGMSNGNPANDTIVYKLEFEDASFLFLGDCRDVCWDQIKNSGLDADVLSVHGYVPEDIISAVSPKIIVYDNLTKDSIKPEGVKIYSKEQGTVMIMSDGSKYLISTTGKA